MVASKTFGAYDYGILEYSETKVGWEEFQFWANLGDQSQALRLANTTPGAWPQAVGGWTPRDNFARVTDGLSNTAIFAEKHVPTKTLGQCCDSATGKSDGFVFFNGPWDARELMACFMSAPRASGC